MAKHGVIHSTSCRTSPRRTTKRIELANRAKHPNPTKSNDYLRRYSDSPSLRKFLFVIPNGLVRIQDRDLKAAGIPKKDERGWSVDVHALCSFVWYFAFYIRRGTSDRSGGKAALGHATDDERVHRSTATGHSCGVDYIAIAESPC